MNLTKLSPPFRHFGITIFQQEEEKRGIPRYQTWHIVNNSITFYTIIRVHSAFSLVASCVLLKYTRTDDVN